MAAILFTAWYSSHLASRALWVAILLSALHRHGYKCTTMTKSFISLSLCLSKVQLLAFLHFREERGQESPLVHILKQTGRLESLQETAADIYP
jgi:hypothetical protein